MFSVTSFGPLLCFHLKPSHNDCTSMKATADGTSMHRHKFTYANYKTIFSLFGFLKEQEASRENREGKRRTLIVVVLSWLGLLTNILFHIDYAIGMRHEIQCSNASKHAHRRNCSNLVADTHALLKSNISPLVFGRRRSATILHLADKFVVESETIVCLK